MTIINVRGTSGSGKSTLVRKVIERIHGSSRELFVEERKRPIGTVYDPGGRTPFVFVPGHYYSPCGGCDSIAQSYDPLIESNSDYIYSLILRHHGAGQHVLYEGLLLSADTKRAIKLSYETNSLIVIALSTPFEECLASIKKRRAQGGRSVEFGPNTEKNAMNKYKGVQTAVRKMREIGIPVHEFSREDALSFIVRTLGIE